MALKFKISVRNFVYCSIGTFEKEKHKKKFKLHKFIGENKQFWSVTADPVIQDGR